MPVVAVLFMVLLAGYALLIQYYRRGWEQLPSFRPDGTAPSTPVSLVIALRNEEPRIPGLMKALSGQDYPRHLLQILMVDDFSEDGTAAAISSYTRQYELPVTLIRMQEVLTDPRPQVAFKKKALETGLYQATGKLIITTDADCTFGTRWLHTLVRFYEGTGAKFIAAPVKMQASRKLVALFQSIDFTTLQAITGASVYRRIHTLCNGANLAYEKTAFEEVGGFRGIDGIASGDDMLLQYKIFKKYPQKVFYLKSEPAIVTTSPEPGWREFFQQRIRWASKATYYEDKYLFPILLLVYLLNLGFFVMALWAVFNPLAGVLFLLAFTLKLLIEFRFVRVAADFFGQGHLLKYFPLLQPLHILYTLIAGWLGQFGSFEWKGRRIQNSAKFNK